MARLAGMHEKRRRSGGRQGGRNLAPDVAGLAHAGHDHAPLGRLNQFDRLHEAPGIQFNAKGQNDKLRNSAIQNCSGKLVTVAPKGATDAKVQFPMVPYDKR